MKIRSINVDKIKPPEVVMKTMSYLVFFFVMISASIYANGVAIINAQNAVYLRLDSTIVKVSVESQISVTTTTQYFTNIYSPATVKYGFPLPEQASATQLRWKVNGEWYTASVAGTAQDTTLPGGGTPHPNLVTYLGRTPLYFNIPQQIVGESTLAVELTYVELLPYAFGNVSYVYPSDYHLIQSNVIGLQRLEFELTSPRLIDSIRVLSSHAVEQITNNGNSASVVIRLYELQGNQNYKIQYSLNANQLGLFAFSTTQPDSLVPDQLGRGFLTFIAEPDPGATTATISKVFTLIIDRSGSMYGTKIVQARDAASFIVNNLNPGDHFNLIDFDDIITSFRPAHVPYTTQARDSALAYITTLTARGMTNISGAFSTAVPQFATANDSTANIIIFLTDGQPTVGITNTEPLVQHVNSLILATETNISLFSFGIGTDVNQQLLTLISANNKGFAEFLGNDELYSRITSFYLTIRNPVLLNSQISFNPPIVSQIFPDSLPNLYKGKQMIIAGRYQEAAPVQITLSGTTFGNPVSYSYDVNLSNSTVPSYQFLPKIWAKQKIESLMVRYYALNPNSPEAIAIKNQIIEISRAYGVISQFTSFTGGTNVEDETTEESSTPVAFELLGNYPNPFNPSTTIQIRLNTEYTGLLEIRIYNILGQIVRVLYIQVNGSGLYNIMWDGFGMGGSSLSSGIYFYGIELNNTVLVGKMNLMK
jgi:Ca-activated chloride channel family protein